jgi:acyl-CoA thioesterase-1
LHAARNAAMALAITFASWFPANAAAEPVTIAALGDSLTQGYGLPPQDGFVPQLEAWLRARGAEATVINAGVSGDTTAGGLSRLDWTLTPEVEALIVNLGGNDMLRGIDPAVSRANLDAILTAAAARGLPVLLVSLRAPGNYGAEFKAAFDAMYPELAAKHGAILTENFFLPLIDQGSRRLDPALMQADGLHPSAAGVAKVVDSLGPLVLELIGRTGAAAP